MRFGAADVTRVGLVTNRPVQPGQRGTAMHKKGVEPPALRRGRLFHQAMQATWRERHGGAQQPMIEKALANAIGPLGRADVRVVVNEDDDGSGHPFQAIVELKDRDFDRLSPRSLRQLIARDRRQLLRYVSALIDLTSAAAAGLGESYAMGSMAYSRGPSDPNLRAAIEAFFDEQMLAVIWEDESEEEAKARLG